MTKRAKAVWQKIVTITEFWVGLPKSKKPELGQRGKNSSYDHLRNCYKDPLVPAKLQFFEEIAKSLNKFLLVFQTDKPVAGFLAETLEKLLSYFCSKFVKKDVMSKASTASKLIKIDLNDENNLVSVTNLDLGFGIKYELKQLKSEKKLTDAQEFNFKLGAQQFLIKTYTQLKEKRCLKCLSPSCMVKC